jgi:tetratricopeptide (TPR) repeat protein
MRSLLLLISVVMPFALCGQKKYNKHAHQIKTLLEDQKIDKALVMLDKLVVANPESQYYAELQISVLQQIIAKIKAMQQDIDVPEDDGAIPAHLRPQKPQTLDTTSIEVIALEQVLKADKSKENLVSAFDDLVIDTSSQIQDNEPTKKLSKREERKRKKRIALLNEKFEVGFTEPSVSIDSTLLTDAFNESTITSSEKTKAKTANGGKKQNSDEEIFKNELEETNTIPIKSKSQKVKEREAKLIAFYQQMDVRVYEKQLIDAARRNTLFTKYADTASALLYRTFLDTFDRGIKIHDSILQKVEEADEQFTLMQYADALTKYNEAMTAAPNYFGCYIKMADAYAKIREDSMALVYYKTAIKVRPKSTEPYFALAKYYFKKGEYQEALDNTLDALLIYPDRKFFSMIEDIAQHTAHDFNSQWLPRPVYPILPNSMDEIVVDKKSPWFFYQAAKQDFASYANPDGVMRPNELSGEKYLEVNAWINMLDSANDASTFVFARQLRKIGYLDCYVLISLFHHDLLPQLQHLVATNPQKVQTYLKMLTEWDKKKYDKLRMLPDVRPAQKVEKAIEKSKEEEIVPADKP